MAVREYFSFRYAIPGYTFILLVVLVNYVTLLKVLRQPVSDVFGALLAFVSLFTGSAIGFLVSQIWYLWYQAGRGWFGHVDRELQELLHDTYGIETELQKKGIEPFLTYIRFRWGPKNEKRFEGYFQKRMDLYHLLSSTITTFGLAWASGILFRLVFWLCFGYPIFTDLFADLLSCSELWVQIIILITVFFLALGFHRGRRKVMTEYSLMVTAYLTNLRAKINEKELKNAFPKYSLG